MKEQLQEKKPFLQGGMWHRVFTYNGKAFRAHLPGSLQQEEAYAQFLVIENTFDEVYKAGEQAGRGYIARELRVIIGVASMVEGN